MKQALAVVLAVACTAALIANTPAENRARAEAIKQTLDGIAAELEQTAHGDWGAWEALLQPYRGDVFPKLDAAANRLAAFKEKPTEVESPLLRIDAAWPMFEMPSYALYAVAPVLSQPAFIDGLPSAKAFIAVSKWLKSKNIDLIVVPAPRLIEVYGDVLGPTPGGTPAPWMRHFISNLAKADVEVVDLLPLYRIARAQGGEPLYLAADGHWSDRAQIIAAAEIARRLRRYDFVKTALAQPARFKATPTHVAFPGANFELLTPEQKVQVKTAVEATPVTAITTRAGVPFEEPADSPVIVIGDSFTHYFRFSLKKGSGIDALLSKDINIAVSNISMGGASIEPVIEFIRRPALLARRRVVVWVINNTTLTNPAESWTLPALR